MYPELRYLLPLLAGRVPGRPPEVSVERLTETNSNVYVYRKAHRATWVGRPEDTKSEDLGYFMSYPISPTVNGVTTFKTGVTV